MTKHYTNQFDQPVGEPLTDWHDSRQPSLTPIEGQSCCLAPLDPVQHMADLFAVFSAQSSEKDWTYLPYGPFHSHDEFSVWLTSQSKHQDPFFYAIMNKDSHKAVGLASYSQINPAHGSIEVGHIHFSPTLQRTTLATEAMFLMMKHAFEDLGYRRYEWKCDALNERSRKAALRLGFTFEGIFRQAVIYKGRNRDTAWFSVIDKEWPRIKQAFEKWLSPKNFDTQGQQLASLGLVRETLSNAGR